MKTNKFADWMKANFTTEELNDMANNGVGGGFKNLVTSQDTTDLYNRYKDDIWEIVKEESEEMGLKVMEMLNGCNQCPHNADTFENLMVWIAAETIAIQLSNI